MQCHGTTALSLLKSAGKETAVSTKDEYGGDDQMTKEEVNDERRGEERRQNAISNRTASILIPYSDARSINIQLHQDRVALSILLLFSHSFSTFPPRRIRRVYAYLKD